MFKSQELYNAGIYLTMPLLAGYWSGGDLFFHIIVLSTVYAGFIYRDYEKGWTKHKRDLHVAAEQGWLESVRRLLEEGAEVNARNGFGFTPAVRLRRLLGRGRFLLDQGVDVNALNRDQETPLNLASDERVREFLKQRGGRTRFKLKW